MPIWAECPDLGKDCELAEFSKVAGGVVTFYEVDDGVAMWVYGAWRSDVLVRDIQWIDGAGSGSGRSPSLFPSISLSKQGLEKTSCGYLCQKRLAPEALFPSPQRLLDRRVATVGRRVNPSVGFTLQFVMQACTT